MRNVLVTGGAGFIGSHLCDALINKGKRVICVDNLVRGRLKNIEHLSNNDQFIFIEADAGNKAQMLKVMRDYNIQYVYHLAANSDIQASAIDPQVEFDFTMKTTWSLLSAMSESGVKKIFFASTSAVYGQKGGESLSEDAILRPISYYGSAKMASEAYIYAFAHMNDMDALIFRFPNVIGSRLTHGVIYDFINKLKNDPSKLDVLGNGTQSKPYMHVSDLITCIMLLSERTKGVEIYNIGVNTESNVRKIAEIVCDEMGLIGIPVYYGEENIGWKGDVPHFKYSLDKIHSVGWSPMLSSDEAVIQTVREVLGKI